MRPLSEDPLEGPFVARRAAQIYVRIGEYDEALDLLELLLSVPTDFTVNILRLDPIWDPLRELPRFKKLLRENK
jgi:serine/threonine-protein kinase